MTQKERIELLEAKVASLEAQLQLLTSHERVAKAQPNTKVITSYGPKIVKEFLTNDELMRSRGG